MKQQINILIESECRADARSNKDIFAYQTSRPLSVSGKITSLGFVWFQGKNIQSSGTIKNHSLASLILNLKLKITFVKPVKNGITQKNEYGGRISTQLDIRNLNQIGCRTEETFLRDEEILLSGEETLLRAEETLLRGEETFLSGEEILLGGEETLLRAEETLLRGEETFLSGEEILLSGEETFLRAEEAFLRGEETFRMAEETFLRGEETFLKAEETFPSGKQAFLSGEQTFLRSEETCGSGEEPFLNCECTLSLKKSIQKSKIKIYLKNNRR